LYCALIFDITTVLLNTNTCSFTLVNLVIFESSHYTVFVVVGRWMRCLAQIAFMLNLCPLDPGEGRGGKGGGEGEKSEGEEMGRDGRVRDRREGM
jgi:hypothetical protein